ncbi:MAG: hypothetical protein H7A51_00630 [Akkermansiaceae bacterium]|nr:hypothetical protein [Akkermansiaceae bacterium]
MKPLLILITSVTILTLGSCALVTVPVKVVGKVATTTVGLAGKAAGAGIDAIKNKKDKERAAEKAEPSAVETAQ